MAAGNLLLYLNWEVQERLLSRGFTVERENCLRQKAGGITLGNSFCLFSSQNILFRGELSPFYFRPGMWLRTNGLPAFLLNFFENLRPKESHQGASAPDTEWQKEQGVWGKISPSSPPGPSSQLLPPGQDETVV